jgi:periplasmic protein TonB
MRTVLVLALFAVVHAQTPPAVYKPGNGVTLPRVVKQVKADYTNAARDRRIEGKVLLDVVVRADGSVGDVNVASSLDAVYGLDDNAVKAMKQWSFAPGTKDGKPVAVGISVEMTFALK